ncbi:MAG: hypothetical protein IT454_14270 [Planctomycetes bacterium]|nr:hypothetical protein [Planctomycetota bacterium]
MKLVPLVCALVALFTGCALFAPRVDEVALGEQLSSAERALEDGHESLAREELERLLPELPAGALSERAARLERALAARELEPFEASFSELRAALNAGDDALAQRILSRVLALGPRGAALQRAEGFRNIVDGRASAAALDLAIEVEPGAAAGEYRVFLAVRQALGEPVRIRCPGSALDYTCIGISEAGIENRTKRRILTDALAELDLESGAPRRVALATFELPSRGLIAVRAQWELDSLGGTVTRGGRELPANQLVTRSAQVERLDPRLPKAPVEPAELAAYLERGAPAIAALLERAVRIEGAQRARALDLATPRLLAATDGELDHWAPALRWLAELRQPPTSAGGWRQWLQERAALKSKPARPTLDLPLR